MGIPNQQIGWGQREKLLWEVSKQLEYLTKIVAALNLSVDPATNLVVNTLSTTSTGLDNIKIGTTTGAYIYDDGTNNTIEIKGLLTPTSGFIKFGSGSANTTIGTNGSYINLAGASSGTVIPNYANNAAALAGGLVNGDLYRTTDTLKVVHP
jgi:hypothetical protein